MRFLYLLIISISVKSMPISYDEFNIPNNLVLDIRNNKIGDTGLVAIADAMASNSAIQRLQIFGNNFDDQSADAFRELISTRFEYFQVECDVKPYVVDGKPLVAKNNLDVDMVVVDK